MSIEKGLDALVDGAKGSSFTVRLEELELRMLQRWYDIVAAECYNQEEDDDLREKLEEIIGE